jgi:hypothetical protein
LQQPQLLSLKRRQGLRFQLAELLLLLILPELQRLKFLIPQWRRWLGLQLLELTLLLAALKLE